MVLSKIPIKALVAFACIGGVFGGSAMIYMQRRADKYFNNHHLVVQAKDLLSRNVKALEFIGHPIKYPGEIAFEVETEEETKFKILHMKIPFSGSKMDGNLNVEAIVDPINQCWQIYTLKAQITSNWTGPELPSTNLVIYRQQS